eukprot:5187411-Amphidinium_carterae.1
MIRGVLFVRPRSSTCAILTDVATNHPRNKSLRTKHASAFGRVTVAQANYAAANSVLDSLAGLWNAQVKYLHHTRIARRCNACTENLATAESSSLSVERSCLFVFPAAWAIQWGPWAEVGMATQANTLKRAKATGVGAITLAQGMTVMSSVLAGAQPLAGAAHIRWAKYLKMVHSVAPLVQTQVGTEVQSVL